MYRRMRIFARFLSCLLLLAAFAPLATAQTAQPQRPFAQLIDLWQRQLDRIAGRMAEPGLLASEFEGLRDQIGEVRSAAIAGDASATSSSRQVRKRAKIRMRRYMSSIIRLLPHRMEQES